MLVTTPCDAGVQAACRRERVMFYMLRLCIFHASAATCNVGLLVHVFPPQADTCCACDVQRAAFQQQWRVMSGGPARVAMAVMKDVNEDFGTEA